MWCQQHQHADIIQKARRPFDETSDAWRWNTVEIRNQFFLLLSHWLESHRRQIRPLIDLASVGALQPEVSDQWPGRPSVCLVSRVRESRRALQKSFHSRCAVYWKTQEKTARGWDEEVAWDGEKCGGICHILIFPLCHLRLWISILEGSQCYISFMVKTANCTYSDGMQEICHFASQTVKKLTCFVLLSDYFALFNLI